MTSQRSIRKLLVLAAAFVLSSLLGALAPCHAAEDRKALIQMGNMQRKAGDDLSALAYFQRAHALGATPESIALIGTCEFALNRFVDAEIHLAEAMKSAQDAWIRKNHVVLSEYLASTKAMLGWIEVVGTPAGADVEVGGKPVGRLPLSGRVRVASGEVNVRMDAPGFRIARKDVQVPADQVTRLTMNLVPMTANEAKAQAKAGPAVERRAAPAQPDHAVDGDVTARPAPSTSPHAGPSYRTAGWITAGAAVVLLGTGVGAIAVKESNTQNFNDYMKELPAKRCNEALTDNGGSECTGFLERSRTAKVIGYGALAGAALAATVSVILLSANPGDDAGTRTRANPGPRLAQSPRPNLLCAPTLTQLGGACALTF